MVGGLATGTREKHSRQPCLPLSWFHSVCCLSLLCPKASTKRRPTHAPRGGSPSTVRRQLSGGCLATPQMSQGPRLHLWNHPTNCGRSLVLVKNFVNMKVYGESFLTRIFDTFCQGSILKDRQTSSESFV
jgi:hypothetical protein